MRLLRVLLYSTFVILTVLFFVSCSVKKPEHNISFYVEIPKTAGVFESKHVFTLPVSEKQILVAGEPVFNIDAFSDCLVVEKFDDGLGTSIPCLFFRIKDEYEIRLRQAVANKAGLKFILVADGKPLGFCNISNKFSRNELYFYIETLESGEKSTEQLDNLSFILNSYILEFREYKQKR